MKSVLLIFSILISQVVFASCGNPENVLTYANGMFNEKVEAQSNLNDYRAMYVKKYPQRPIHLSHLAYNTNEALLVQLYEVYTQFISSTGEAFWSKMAKVYPYANENLKSSIADQAVRDENLSEQIEAYQSFVEKRYTVVTVAHSQGNFYTLSAFRYINSSSTKMISVATPAHEVYDQGPYFTFKTDPIGELVPLALIPNLDKAIPSLFDHGFATHYLQDENAKSKILEATFKAFAMPPDNFLNLSYDEHDGHFNSDMRNVLRWFQKESASNDSGPTETVLAAAINELAQNSNLNCESRSYTELTNLLKQTSLLQPDLKPQITQALVILKSLQFK
ncbi:hypothetical protein CIK05_08485 [Bdellovibrio sp. qaytius]|nr:hypothetical protein CIK05_08485 [Bdellovibrio sp. qaytius]